MHFPHGLPARRIGRRLAAVNLSDLAAAGADPGFALATVAAPATFDHKSFFAGLLDTFEEYGLALAGGDLARSTNVHTTLTVFGRRRPRGRLLRRDRACTGDVLWLGGTLGDSGAGRILLAQGARATAKTLRLPESPKIPRGLRGAARGALARHLDPAPQLELGAWLASRRRAAAIDVSDGLLLDLERLARASMVCCELDARVLPLSPGFAPLCEFLGLEPFEVALCGGEDYVLLFSLPVGVRPPVRFGATIVGRVTTAVERRQDARVLVHGAALGKGQFHGWDHLSS